MTTAIAICSTVIVVTALGFVALRAILSTRLAIARVEAAARIRTPAAGAAPRRVGHRVTVHTTPAAGDLTFFGVMAEEYTDRVVLEDAELVTPAGAKPLPSRQDIDRVDISWIDVHALVALPEHAPALVPAPQRESPMVGTP